MGSQNVWWQNQFRTPEEAAKLGYVASPPPQPYNPINQPPGTYTSPGVYQPYQPPAGQENLVGQGYGAPSTPMASPSIATPAPAPATYFTPTDRTAEVPQQSQVGLPGHGLNEKRGINYGLIPGILSNAYGVSYPNAYGSANNQGILSEWLSQILQNYPTNLGASASTSLMDLLGSFGGFLNQFNPVQQGNLQYLAKEGLPGTQQVQQEQQRYGTSAQKLLGGDGAYGVQPLLNQVIEQGLPGQGSIEQLLGSYAQQAMGGGLTPEYVQAQRSLILDPSQEALTGNLNRMAGGAASLTSPAYQELLRRNEERFNEQLISEAFRNRNQTAGTALNAFQSVGQNAYPYVSLAGNLANQLAGQSLQNYQAGGQLGLQNLSTIQNLAMQPYQTAVGGLGNQQQQLLGSLGNFQAGQQQYGLGQQSQMNDLLRLLIGIYAQQNPNQPGGATDLGRLSANFNFGFRPGGNPQDTAQTPPYYPDPNWGWSTPSYA